MLVIVLDPSICGGLFLEPSPYPQKVPDQVGEQLISMGSARKYETKVVEVKETKAKKLSASSRQVRASRKKTQTKPDKPTK